MALTTTNMGLKIWNLLGDLFNHNDLAGNFQALDTHDHTTGNGVQIPTGGLANGAVTAAKTASGTLTSGQVSATGGITTYALGITPVGSVMHYAGAADVVDPDGVTRWLLCDGRALNRLDFARLFSALGTIYGIGDGSTTFNIPDARGRIAVGAGAGAGLTSRSRGATGGEEQHVLANGEMPVHNHSGQTGSNVTGLDSPEHAHDINALTTVNSACTTGPAPFLSVTPQTRTTEQENAQHTHIVPHLSISNDGGGSSHNNMQPYFVLNHIIKSQ